MHRYRAVVLLVSSVLVLAVWPAVIAPFSAASGGGVSPSAAPVGSASAYAIIGKITMPGAGFAENPYVSADDTVYVPAQYAGYVGIIHPGTTSGSLDDSIAATYPRAAVLSDDDTLFIAEYTAGRVAVFAPGASTRSYNITVPDFPLSLGINGDDTLMIASYRNCCGSVSIVAPNGGSPAASVLNVFAGSNPSGVAVDDSGNFYVGSETSSIKTFAKDSLTVTSTITGLNNPASLGVRADDTIVAISRGAQSVAVIPHGASTPSSTVANGAEPVAMGLGPDGNAYVANYFANSLTRFDPVTDDTETIMTGLPGAHGVAVTSGGLIYVATNDGGVMGTTVIADLSASLATPSASEGSPVSVSVLGLPTGAAIDDSTVSAVWWGDDTLPFTRSGNAIDVTAPAGSGAVPVVLEVRGGGAVTAGNFTYASPDPGPAPTPASAPTLVVVAAGDASAVVAWEAPVSQGSYPVTRYQVTSTPLGRSCLTAGTECTVTGLANDVSYTFRVRALTGAGWGAWSAPSAAVTPVKPAIVITGTRVNDRGESRIEVSGTTVGMEMGAELTPWWRKLGSGRSFRAADAILLDAEGTFTWSRAASESRTWRVYVTADGVRSNTVTIR